MESAEELEVRALAFFPQSVMLTTRSDLRGNWDDVANQILPQAYVTLYETKGGT